jgi:hypothetical protein
MLHLLLFLKYRRPWFWLLLCLAPNIADLAQSPLTNQYVGIAHGNMFHLRPPLLDKTNTLAVIRSPLHIELRGITTIFENPQAIIEVFDVSQKQSKISARSFILEVGQHEGGLTILEIDSLREIVRIDDQGEEVTLKLSNVCSTDALNSNVADGTVPRDSDLLKRPAIADRPPRQGASQIAPSLF